MDSSSSGFRLEPPEHLRDPRRLCAQAGCDGLDLGEVRRELGERHVISESIVID